MHNLIVVLLFCHSSWVFYQVEGNPYSSELLGSGGGDVGGGRAERWGPERGQPPAAEEGGLHSHLIWSYWQASMINIKSQRETLGYVCVALNISCIFVSLEETK